MKSLVFHGNGCTAYNSKGEIVFRVDNYQEKNSTKVYLMDLHGQVLFSIQKQVINCKYLQHKIHKYVPFFFFFLLLLKSKPLFIYQLLFQKLRVFGRWNGYKWSSELKGRPWFQVRRSCRFLKRELTCNVGVGCDQSNIGNSYMLKKSDGKSAFKIVDSTGETVAEVSYILHLNTSFYGFLSFDRSHQLKTSIISLLINYLWDIYMFSGETEAIISRFGLW